MQAKDKGDEEDDAEDDADENYGTTIGGSVLERVTQVSGVGRRAKKTERGGG